MYETTVVDIKPGCYMGHTGKPGMWYVGYQENDTLSTIMKKTNNMYQ